ncbi:MULTISPECIES: glycosyltransferase [Flavobacteriaceae]|uniref:Glycosyltransferase n=1 Tax=Lutibacter litoralis TaxID=321268 RepID=A0ABV5JZA1_9FLAO|nr:MULTISPECIES: glycosyltransferase [Flavobacteriaceae]
MKTIKTPIIPINQTFAKIKAPHELHKEAICIFVATGFFLDQDTYWKDEVVLRPATINTLDENGFLIESTPWFQWHYTPQQCEFSEALQQFTSLFETIVNEQVGDKKVILPLSGGLDSRTQAVALKHLQKDVKSYSYEFKGGYPETKIAKRIAKACDFDFNEYQIEKGYLWNCIEELAELNQCYSEFTHPRQMAIVDEFETMGEIFSLGHWGDVLFDKMCNEHLNEHLNEHEELAVIYKKIIKKGGLELATALWNAWELPNTFETYLKQRIQKLLNEINITNSSAKIRAFKSLYWAPRWTAINLNVFQKKHPITLPYFDDNMCEFICTIPESFLADRKLQIEYIKSRNKKLAAVQWQAQKPFNLNTYSYNKVPYNLPYRVIGKLQRVLSSAIGKPFIQRNWELQFLGLENEKHLKNYLEAPSFQKLIPTAVTNQFYKAFKKGDKVVYSHPVSMLLTLALWNKKTIKVMDKQQLKVSVVLPIFNGEKTLADTLDSLEVQTFKDFELIACIYGTNDASEAILNTYNSKFKKLVILKNSINLGLGPTMNRLVANTSGEYIAIAEQDDFYYPKRLELQVNLLDSKKDVGLVSGIAEFWDGEKVTGKFPGLLVHGKQYPEGEELFLLNYRNQIKVVNSCMMIRKSVHIKKGLYFTKHYPSISVDWTYILRFSLISKIYGINEILVRLDRRPERNSVTTHREQSFLATRELIRSFKYEYPKIITEKDYKFALRTQYLMEMNTKAFIGYLCLFMKNVIMCPFESRYYLSLKKRVLKKISS